jgi:hypothetical protein
MKDPELHQRAKEAADGVRQARPGWGATQETARTYLAAKEHQRDELAAIRDIGGDHALSSNVSDGIRDVERDIANIKAEIPTLKPGWPDY